MLRKIMVTGAGSRIGRPLTTLLRRLEGVEVVALGQEDLDILDEAAVRKALEREKPSTVINCAGFNDVVAAEHAASEKLPVNTRGICNLARAAAELKFYLCFFSSKQVFNGKKAEPYDEEDEMWPVNQYGVAKQGGEEMVANLVEKNYLIVRSDYLFGFPGDWIGELKERLGRGEEVEVADDFLIAPTYVGDLAAAMVMLVSEWAAGVYHYTNEAGSGVSCCDFSRAVAERIGLDTGLIKGRPQAEIDYGYPINLPPRAILSLERFKKLFPSLVRPWQTALEEYLEIVSQ
ncbi:MAG: NAD(P)-dependent oxidoreductase [Deltaproteobacteria bacterium]|nr:NAD(P)-dependent oxidoreductase [Deltaproteobacteria bacterium]